MQLLIFNGSLDQHPSASINKLVNATGALAEKDAFQVRVFRLSEAGIPFFDPQADKAPAQVQEMLDAFLQADHHIWITPLYHGSMTGAMKNALDWLEFARTHNPPYLTNKVVGLMSVADGSQAIQAINAMDAVAKSLRAWVAPFSVPMVRKDLFSVEGSLQPFYQEKIKLLLDLLKSR